MCASVYLIFIIASFSNFNIEGRNVIKENISNSLDGYINSRGIDETLKRAGYGPFSPASCNCDPGYCVFDRRLQRNVCRCPVEWYRVTNWMVSECKKCNCGEGIGCKLEGFFDPAVRCFCPEGYSSIDSKCKATCEANPCLNNGTCKVKDDSIVCECEPDFSGEFCEIKGCGKNICENGGACRVLKSVKYCQCLNRTRGERCELVDGCDELNCGNNSLCSLNITTGKAFCACSTEGFSYDSRDKTCKENCVKKICQNGGICETVGDSKFCLCMAGIFGDLCDIVSICEGFDCGADAHCQFDVLTGNPFCKCKEKNLNFDPRDGKCKRSCHKEKCQNEGTCGFSGNFKFCNCKEGTSGDLCQILDDIKVKSLVIGNEAGALDLEYDKSNSTLENYSSEMERIAKIQSTRGFLYPKCDCKYGYCEKDKDGELICKCHPEWGLITWTKICKKCDCGKGANCTYVNWFFSNTKYCYCKDGYTDVDGTCKGSCSKNPCKNGGTCTLQGNDIVCSCKSPFVGEYCKIEKHCEPNFCQNGGTCKIVNYNQTCQCLIGTRGHRCEEVDGCANLNCGTESTCTFNITTGKPFCRCDKAELKYDTRDRICKESCDEQNCQNGGICESVGESKFCLCMAGIFGDLCDIVSVCEGFICGENAECQFDVLTGSPFCKCKEKRLNYDPADKKCKKSCYRRKCQNGGICAFSGNFKFCQCKQGTTGDLCQITDTGTNSEDN